MIVYCIKLERISMPDCEPSYYKGRNGDTEMTSILSYAKLFHTKIGAENKLYILENKYFKDCKDFKFSIVDVEIKEL